VILHAANHNELHHERRTPQFTRNTPNAGWTTTDDEKRNQWSKSSKWSGMSMTKHTYTILQLIYTSTCGNWQTQLRTAWFCCSSFTANILVLVAIHAFTLRRWCQNSLPWCYLHDLRTIHRLCTITPSPYHIGHGNVTAVKIVIATNLMTNSTDLCSHRRPLLASDTQQCLLGHWGSAQVRVQSDNELIQCRQQGPLKVLDSFHQLATNIYTHNWLIFIIQHLQLTSLQSTWKLFTNSIQI